MTRDEILEYFKDVNYAYNDCTRYDTLKRMIDELQESCTDAISRQAAIDALTKTSGIRGDALKALYDLPPVTAEKVGQWIYDRTKDWDGECKYECSECGMGSDVDYAYCMRCGCKMQAEGSE